MGGYFFGAFRGTRGTYLDDKSRNVAGQILQNDRKSIEISKGLIK